MKVGYPKTLPYDAAQDFLGLVRGKNPGHDVLIHSAWNLIGYGASLGFPLQSEPIGSDGSEDPVAPVMTDEEAFVKVLDHAGTPSGLQDPIQGPLASIALTIVLRYVWKYLQKQLPNVIPV